MTSDRPRRAPETSSIPLMDGAYMERLARVGSAVGLLGALTYLAWSTLPVPGRLDTLMHIALGPLVVAGFVGIGAALALGGVTVRATIGTVYGVLAGAFFSAMTIVQTSNLLYFRRYMEGAEPAVRESFGRILRGVFTVQLGLDLVWDLFVTLGMMLIALAMLGRSRAATALGILGVAVGALTLFLNLLTLPVPPAEAGYFDAGPFAGAWFLVVSAWIVFRRGLLPSRPAALEGAPPG